MKYLVLNFIHLDKEENYFSSSLINPYNKYKFSIVPAPDNLRNGSWFFGSHPTFNEGSKPTRGRMTSRRIRVTKSYVIIAVFVGNMLQFSKRKVKKIDVFVQKYYRRIAWFAACFIVSLKFQVGNWFII